MANRRLSDKDIDQLLNQYRSERKRLSFQLENIRTAIAELKALRSGSETTEGAEPPVKRGPGRPRKNAAEAPKRRRRKPGRRKKRVVKGGYRLSPWDTMILEAIRKSGKLLTKEQLLKASVIWARKNEPGLDQDEVAAKLTRVLQKLSGARGDLGTYSSGLRRGYHYGLRDWFFASSGKLRKQHLDKLVLAP